MQITLDAKHVVIYSSWMPIATQVKTEEPEAAPAVPADPTFEDPHRLAEVFLQNRYLDSQKRPTIRFWNGNFWVWKDQHYSILPEEVLESYLWKELRKEFARIAKPDKRPKVQRVKVSNVRTALATEVTVEGRSIPVWLGHGQAARRLLSFKNGLIDLDALMLGEEVTLLPHTPLWFSSVVLPFDYEPAAQAPQWLAFLDQMLEGDAERIRLLHEWLGYLISGDTKRQKFLVLLGPPASGKSTALNVMTELLGPENVSHQPLDTMFNRFQLFHTLGKLANITTEADHFCPGDEGKLKQFTAGERMSFEQKQNDVFSATPTARLVCATNAMPAFGDRPGGIGRRMVLLPFNVTIPEGERDSTLGERLNAELAGIFNLAIEAYRLAPKKEFSSCRASKASLKEYERESQPELVFLDEHCKVQEEGEVSKPLLYEEYRQFCIDNGHKPIINDALFAKQVRKMFPEVKEVRRRTLEGQTRYWVGIGLS